MQIKLLTYNIHKGFNWRNSQATIKKIKEAIVSSGVDLVFLQEIVGENSSAKITVSLFCKLIVAIDVRMVRNTIAC